MAAPELDPATEEFYRNSMRSLQEARIPFLVGGAYAFSLYTGISRHTKDFDLFVRPADLEQALAHFREDGFEAEKTFPHWLAKVKCGDDCIDLIYRAGNGMCEVDAAWFERALQERCWDSRLLSARPTISSG